MLMVGFTLCSYRAPKGTPSFKNPKRTIPLSVTSYKQGHPIITAKDEYFTIPQVRTGALAAEEIEVTGNTLD